MALIRCPTCRYSFEHAGEPLPDKCRQCGGALETKKPPEADDGFERQKTQKLKTVPKPSQ